MVSNNEDWLLDAGDAVVERKASVGYKGLTDLEKTIYCLWVVDYAVRNSGTLDPLDELHPIALDELRILSADQGYRALHTVVATVDDEEAFCQRYHESFEKCVAEIRRDYAPE